MKKFKKAIIFVILLIPFMMISGCGIGHRTYHGHGYQGNYRGGDAYRGTASSRQLSYSERSALEKEYESFWAETESLRTKFNEADIELRQELSKSEPDSQKVISLQREIYGLEAQLTRKQEDHSKALMERYPNAQWNKRRGGFCSYY